jgi:hypothetical protein
MRWNLISTTCQLRFLSTTFSQILIKYCLCLIAVDKNSIYNIKINSHANFP